MDMTFGNMLELLEAFALIGMGCMFAFCDAWEEKRAGKFGIRHLFRGLCVLTGGIYIYYQAFLHDAMWTSGYTILFIVIGVGLLVGDLMLVPKQSRWANTGWEIAAILIVAICCLVCYKTVGGDEP